MFPFIRLAKEVLKFRNAPHLKIGEAHISHHICWPWDLDFALELNNGRTLSLLDLARIPMFIRSGMFSMVRREGWSVAMAGVIVRYRRRIKAFDRFETQSRVIGWDKRFVYVEQSIWKTNGECANQAIYRVAIAGKDGIVDPHHLATLLDVDPQSPEMPAWINTWIEAEDTRPWPPERS